MRLIYVGLVIPRKGLLPLIEALAQVRTQNWRLDVVGSLKMDRRYANRCRKLSAHLGLAPRIRFRGEIADTDLMEIMAEAHLLCMPFAYEGFGITTAEAMRCGVPVMGSTSRCHPGVDRPWR
jgi:glycosyltransferase involved in cell wall biosynthesis